MSSEDLAQQREGAEDGHAPPQGTWGKVKETLRRLGPAGPMAVVFSTLPPVGSIVLLSTVSRTGPWLKSHGAEGVALYVAAAALLAGFAVIPTYATSVVAGWAFGFAVGFPAGLVAFVSAALIAYALTRGVAKDRVEKLIAERPKWEAVRRAMVGSGFGKALFIVTLLRLPPTSPFAPLNMLLAATRTPVLAYGLGTALGLAPRTAVVVYAAAGLAELDFSQTRQTGMYFVGLGVTIAVVLVISAMAKREIERVTRMEGTKEA